MKAHNDVIECVQEFIGAVNERDAQKAQSFAHPDLEMHFAAGVSFTDVAGFFEWLQQRTPVSRYDYDTVHVVETGKDHVVYASGTVTGKTTTGRAFSGVRVLDRFLIRDGKIIKKEAWSDMAEALRNS